MVPKDWVKFPMPMEIVEAGQTVPEPGPLNQRPGERFRFVNSYLNNSQTMSEHKTEKEVAKFANTSKVLQNAK